MADPQRYSYNDGVRDFYRIKNDKGEYYLGGKDPRAAYAWTDRGGKVYTERCFAERSMETWDTTCPEAKIVRVIGIEVPEEEDFRIVNVSELKFPQQGPHGSIPRQSFEIFVKMLRQKKPYTSIKINEAMEVLEGWKLLALRKAGKKRVKVQVHHG
jgi:hypothetical protein